MKALLWIIVLAGALAGCASFQETCELDREFGRAQEAAWVKMKAFPEAAPVFEIPENLEGINAESVMDVDHQTFGYEPVQEPVEVKFQ